MESFYNTDGRPRYFFLLSLACLLVILASVKTIAADERSEKPSEAVSAKWKSSGPYCGIYCLYTTMKLTNREVDFRELVKPEYIGSRKGSSLEDLKKAAEDNGLYAVPVGKLTSQVLRNCPRKN